MLGVFGLLPYTPVEITFSAGVLFFTAWTANKVFAYFYKVPSNIESTYLTALILALIITPTSQFIDVTFLLTAVPAALLAVASKYILAIRKKHIFNPAAFGIAVTGLLLAHSASWWVGTPWMVVPVLLGGLLIVRKLRRFDLFFSFLGVFALGTLVLTAGKGVGTLFATTLPHAFLYAPVFFFATVMLTEPLTMPATRWLRIAFGGFIGLLFLPQVHLGSFYFTPEIALLVGNLFAYITGPKDKLVLTYLKKIKLSPSVYEFVFANPRPFAYAPGQYLEWTLAQKNPDARGMRRYFSISSAPEDEDIRLGVKFYKPASSFKRGLFSLSPGQSIVATQLTGDFTLPKKTEEKLVFISGGIGVTPYTSMIRHLLVTDEKRPIIHLYANRTPADVAYADLWNEAERTLGIRTIYTYSDAGVAGVKPMRIDERLIVHEIPDFAKRTFYISGPQAMVTDCKEMLIAMGVRRRRIKTDYFPGFA
jgi:ferredoxin-NADP reductase